MEECGLDLALVLGACCLAIVPLSSSSACAFSMDGLQGGHFALHALQAPMLAASSGRCKPRALDTR
jgi:hypothetical protein